MEICGGIQGVPYWRFEVTTNDLATFVKTKVATIVHQENLDNDVEVYCFPQVLGDTRGGIKYATMIISMTGIAEKEETMMDMIRPYMHRPKINNKIFNAIVKAYEFSADKIYYLQDHHKKLRELALSPSDLDIINNHRKLMVHNIDGTPHYTFMADMDHLLDDFLMRADTDESELPNYTVINIKRVGDKSDSALSYDILTTEHQFAKEDNSHKLFKALVLR